MFDYDYSEDDPMVEDIRDAAQRLCYASEAEVAAMFVAEGKTQEETFLIVKAGKILLNDRYKSNLEDGTFYDESFEEDMLVEELGRVNNS